MDIFINKFNEIKLDLEKINLAEAFSEINFYNILKRITSILKNDVFADSTITTAEINKLKDRCKNSLSGVRYYHIEDVKGLIQILIDEQEIKLNKQSDTIKESDINEVELKTLNDEKSNKVFIVHGHNEEMKLSVARTLEKLSLNPIILHEQPNFGLTIIEKFTQNSDVSFAVVLLSADDKAYNKNDASKSIKFRARQNVIFELGYFIGKLGRNRVLILFDKENDIELPSDYNGVLYVPYDKEGNWKIKLIKELQACGFSADANSVLCQ